MNGELEEFDTIFLKNMVLMLALLISIGEKILINIYTVLSWINQ